MIIHAFRFPQPDNNGSIPSREDHGVATEKSHHFSPRRKELLLCHRYSNGCLRICNCEDSRQELRRLTRAPSGKLAQHYQRQPDRLSDEDLRQYFLYLANQKKIARSTATIALCGIKFFYEQTQKQPWPTLRFVRPPREWKLPVVLSRKEIGQILAAVRIPVYQVCLKTIYACACAFADDHAVPVYGEPSPQLMEMARRMPQGSVKWYSFLQGLE